MIVDFNNADCPGVIDADVLIIGGGAAGITIALELCNTAHKVVLIESGGLSISRKNQKLNTARNVGIGYEDLSIQCGRYLGGSTNFWGGNCIPMDPIDFLDIEARSGFSWPIPYEEIERYQYRAQKVLGISSAEFGDSLIKEVGISKNEKIPASFVWKAWQFCHFPFRFGEKFRKQLEEADNVTVYLNANLTDVEQGAERQTITTGVIRSLRGKTGKVNAKKFILATGGVENARLLLHLRAGSLSGTYAAGECLGKYFADHPNATIGYMEGADAEKIYHMHQIRHLANGQEVKPCWGLSERAQKDSGILNGVLSIWPVQQESKAVSQAKLLLSLIRRKEFGLKFLINAFLTLPRIIELLPHAAHRLRGGTLEVPFRKDMFEVRLMAETAPNPGSSVTLSDEVEELGLRRAVLNWQLSKSDRSSFCSIALKAKQGIESLGELKLKLADWISDENMDWSEYINRDGHYGHHMGTTRMSTSDTNGVVDINCKVFGVDNMFVAGSSVFPTYGFANPTLTILALAIRLADHLKTELQG